MSLQRVKACGPAAMLLLAVCVSGCGGSSNSASNEIRIGHYASMTGSEATFGQSTDNGIQLAVKEINAAGGIGGKQIKLITYDDKGDVKEAGTAVTRLVTRDEVTAVIGEVASGLSLAGAPVCQEHGVPMITPSSTNPRVTKVGDMISRVCFIDPFQGSVCAKFAREHEDLKAEKMAILYDQAAPYSTGLAEEFRKAFEKLGGTITTEQTYNAGDQDFTAQLTTIRGTEPDAIFVPGYYTDVGNIALQARKLGIEVPLLGGDGWDSAKLAEIAGDSINGSYYSNHYSHQDPSPRVQEFISKYKDEYGSTPDGLAALGYDAMMLLSEAMQRAKSLEGADLAAAIAATRDFEGVTGTITIDENRNAVKPAVMLEMIDGQPTFVRTIDP
jgi:branched-chain amino acid transport system substrate-binding protein